MLQLKNISAVVGAQRIFDTVSFDINDGEQIAVIGPAGSGKTSLLKMIGGQLSYRGLLHTSKRISLAFVEQQHRFKNLSNTNSFYYQQRFNSSDAEDAISVQEYIELECKLYDRNWDEDDLQKWMRNFRINELLDRRLIQLSNGENKRVQLFRALLSKPNVLLLDNPYLGLDVNARALLTEMLSSTRAEKEITIVMATTVTAIPSFITHVLVLDGKGNVTKITKEELDSNQKEITNVSLDQKLLDELLSQNESETFASIVLMKNVNVAYGSKQVLKDINWEVRTGERWALSGANGAGKSTLLSLINADNPQAYANEIYLFDKRRGRGESIWEIKKRIGFVSPELHLFFDASNTVFNVVASGLFDTIGLFRMLNEEQEEKVKAWLKLLQIDRYAQQIFANLSLGIQRLVLLARALIKNPPLLLLDEPAQGLDEQQALLFKTVVEQICSHTNPTLIYVSHFKEEIPSAVTKAIHLDNGRVASIQS